MDESQPAADPAYPPLDPDAVARVMRRAAHDLSPLLAAYLADDTGQSWTDVDEWLLEAAESDPETRWGTLETIATLSKAVVLAAGGLRAEHLPPQTHLLDEDLSPDDAAGIRDAVTLLTEANDPAQELPDAWLLYAVPPMCSVHRYTTATSVLLAAMTALIEGAAQAGQTDAVALWHQILPPQAQRKRRWFAR